MQRTKRLFVIGMFCVFAAALAPHAQAATVTATITGTVYTGSNCYSGATGCVFGLTTNLAGLPFTLVYTFDDSAGIASSSECSATYYYALQFSHIENSGSLNPGTAVLTIWDSGGTPWSFSFGGGTGQTGSPSSSASRYYGGCGGGDNMQYYARANYSGGYTGYAQVQTELWPSTWPSGTLTTSGDWRLPIGSTSVRNYDWSILFTITAQRTSPAGHIAEANGYLMPQYLTVTGPAITCPTGPTLTLNSTATGTNNSQPNILQAFEWTTLGVSLSTAQSALVGLTVNGGSPPFHGGIPSTVTTDAFGTATFRYTALSTTGHDQVLAFVPCGGTSYPPTDVYTYDVSNFDIHQSHLNTNSSPDKDAFTNSSALDQGGIEGTFQYVYGSSSPSFLAKFYLVDTAGDGSYQDGFFDSNGNGSYDSGEPVYCHGGGTSCLPASGAVTPAAAVIATAATGQGINPKLLIVKLQVEKSLVHVICNTSCTSFPSAATLSSAMGCNLDSNGHGISFSDQVNCAAETFHDRFNDAGAISPWPYFFPINTGAGYDSNIKHAYSASCQDTGGHLVTGCAYVGLNMNDAATFAQYKYTPYVQSATNCGGGVCLFETVYSSYSFLW